MNDYIYKLFNNKLNLNIFINKYIKFKNIYIEQNGLLFKNNNINTLYKNINKVIKEKKIKNIKKYYRKKFFYIDLKKNNLYIKYKNKSKKKKKYMFKK